jgi:predicted O-methyltransferase YrrM
MNATPNPAAPTGTGPASGSADFEFTNDWFGVVKGVWEELIPQVQPRRILEIGSYEGASACYLIGKLAPQFAIELHCVDTWEGGVEHLQDESISMPRVEARFHHNTSLAIQRAPHPVNLVVHKGPSDLGLAKLLAKGAAGHFDFIYIDGSHQAPDVLADAVLAFRLLRVGGVMVFDDYLWTEELASGRDPLRCPKPAIDAFVNCYFRKLQILRAPLYQLYVQKTAD